MCAGAGVLDDVGERLLHDPVGGQVDALGERARLALDGELDADARGARALEQLRQLAEPRLRRERGGLLLVAAQQLQRAVHLGHRLAAEVGDPVGRLAHALVARGGPERLRLHDDQRDVVRDHVVELLRDPQPLVGDGALALGDGVGAARPDVEADGAADHAQEREPEQVAVGELGAAREPVDDADEHDRAGRARRSPPTSAASRSCRARPASGTVNAPSTGGSGARRA